eukprot:CAMPEP_0114545306 /NCGR_PEP_ID=MMETSP0114-20121206/3329_1 /TAXON_ID=31324 /ORGANISM="Goniomonas sp, Strain m" /LENGTH=30 /DNA_ID= /DNA_START= /DNA_END= /DNA_ORIENTATION=
MGKRAKAMSKRKPVEKVQWSLGAHRATSAG